MKKSLSVCVGFAMFVLPPSGMAAGRGGVIASYSGTQIGEEAPCSGEGCVGEINTCAEGEYLSIAKGRYAFYEGICDDGVPGQECNGRVTLFQETCSNLAATFKLDGRMVSLSGRGKYRVCYADPGADCAGTVPSEVIVAEGVAYGHLRFWFPSSPIISPEQVTGDTTTTTSHPFSINGKQVKIPLGTSVYIATIQPSAEGDLNCAAANAELGLPPGCGFAGSYISSRTP